MTCIGCSASQNNESTITEQPSVTNTVETNEKVDNLSESVSTPLGTTANDTVVEEPMAPETEDTTLANTKYECFKNGEELEIDIDTKTVCYLFKQDDKKLRSRELQKSLRKENLLKEDESIIANYEDDKLEIIVPNKSGTYDVVDTYTLISKKDENYVSTNYYDKEKNALYYTLNETKSKGDNESDIFIFAMENNVIQGRDINSWDVLLDDAIRNGAATITFGKPVDGRYVAQYTMTLYTKGTYKGYNGVVYSGNNPTVQAPVDVCTLLDNSTLECPDGTWHLDNVNGEMMIRIDSNEAEARYDTSIRHNGYDRHYDYVWISHEYINDEYYYLSHYDIDAGEVWYTKFGKLYEQGKITTADEFVKFLNEENVIFFNYNKVKKDKYYEHIYPNELMANDEQIMRCYFHFWYMRHPTIPNTNDGSYVNVCPQYFFDVLDDMHSNN